MKLVPCDSSFSPDNNDQLCTIKVDHNLERGFILSAAWIKKPELGSPNQITANIKLTCTSPITANQLLTKRVLVANSRVVITKDMQEPIRCNRCQEYGHIHKNCTNKERCTTCVHPHPTNTCSHPNDHHCISCGTLSNHTSSNKTKCPKFAQHTATLNI